MESNILIYGLGGHSKVLSELVNLNGNNTIYFYDDVKSKNINFVSLVNNLNPLIYIAIGNNNIRKNLHLKIKNLFNLNIFGKALIHPGSIISESSVLGNGTMIAANSVIGPSTIVGDFVIINTSSSIDHDCMINSYAHIGPNATLCGNVEIGEGTFVGAGSIILPGIKIGKWSTIGAGSVVIKDVPDGEIHVGNPSKRIK